MTKPKTKSAIPYFGANAKGAPLVGILARGTNMAIVPFVGGGSELPYFDGNIVANDQYHDLWNFYEVSRVDGDELQEKIDGVICHPEQLRQSLATIRADRKLVSPLDRAAAFWACCWLGFKGTGGTKGIGKAMSIRWTGNGGCNPSRIASAKADFSAWREVYKRCQFACLDFREFLSEAISGSRDNPKSVIYSDAPWVEEGDKYLHSFTAEDHVGLWWALNRFEKTRVIVRYGDHPLLRALYRESDGWTWINTKGRTSHGDRDEVLIVKNVPLEFVRIAEDEINK